MQAWHWEVFLKDPGGNYGSYLQWLLSAWGWTISVAVCAMGIALVIGTIVGILRSVQNRLWAGLSQAWIELFRNIPLILQVFLWYQVMPVLIPELRRTSGFVLVIVALGLYTSSRIATQVFSGIRAVAVGQKSAATALGLTQLQSYRYVILPVSFRVILPVLTTEMMSVVKNSSVAFAVSVGELTMFALQAQEETARGTEIYLAVTGLYALSAIIVNRLMLMIQAKVEVPGVASGSRRLKESRC
jgi:glutamate/aspartate transport system permease protein